MKRSAPSAIIAIIAIAAFALVLARQPHVITRPQFVLEETAAFWAPTFTLDPLRYLLEPWAGQLVVLPRAAFLLARLGPPELAPAATILVHAVVVALVAAFMASDRMQPAIPDRRVRAAFGASIAVLPMGEPYISVLSAQWFLGLLVVALSLVAPRRSDYLIVLVAGLSGIGACLAAPLFFRDWRPGRRVDRRGPVLVAVAGVQLAVALAAGRQAHAMDLRWNGVASIAILVTLIVVVSFARGFYPSVRTRASFGYLALVTLVIGLASMGLSARYVLPAFALLALAAVAMLATPRPAGVLFAAGVAFAVVFGFGIHPTPDGGWAAQDRCIGGAAPCRVTVYQPAWSVDWPGDGTYRAPLGFDGQGSPTWPAP